jgi:hypothetical protein
MAKQDEIERDAPDVRVGETWEDFSEAAPRRLRVQFVEEDEDGVMKVQVFNMATYVTSVIRLDRFFPEPGGFRRLA